MKLLLLCAALAPLMVTADDGEPEALPDIEITVQRYRQPKEDVTASVVVLGRRELDAVPGENLRDALLGIAGIDIRPQGGAGAQAGVSLRGSRTEHILVLIDGHRVNTAQGGGVDFSDLPLAEVERIEVLRGGGSALYGSDPLGGVINIVTRRGGDGSLAAKLAIGSWDTYELTLGTGRQLGWGSYRLDLQRFGQVGDFVYEDNRGGRPQRINNRLIRNSVRGGATYRFEDSGELEASFGLYHAVKGVPGRIEFPTPNAAQRDFRYDTGLGYRWFLGEDSELSARLYWQEQERDFFDPSGPFPVDANHRNRQLSAEVLGTIDTARRGRAVVGLDYRRDEIDSTTDGRHHRVTGGVFGLYEFDLGPVTVVPSVRLDGQSGQRPIFSPKFGVMGRPTRSVTLRSNVGRSFRAPSFDDLYWPEDAFARGNPGLRPEHAVEWDVAATWQPSSRTRLDLGYFNRASSDLILWQPGIGGKWMPQNLSRVRFQGIEAGFELGLPWPAGLSLSGSYSYLKATTHSGTAAEIGKQLVGQPFHHGFTELRYEQGDWLADLRVRAVGQRYTTAANTASLPSYAVVDALTRWRPEPEVELCLELRNLLNTSYRTVTDYPLPGLEIRLSAARKF